MATIKYNGIFILCLLLNIITKAQVNDSLIKDNQIDVIKDFKPILSEAIKIPVNPNPEKPEFTKPNYSYQVPDQQFPVQPTLYTIKPLSLGTFLLPKLKNNYTKLGFGNYTSPLFEFYLNSVRNKNTQAGMCLKHLSANGDQAYNNFSNSSAFGYVKKFTESGSYGLDVGYNRNMVNLYGTPNDHLKLSTDPKLVYQLFDSKAFFHKFNKDSTSFTYNLDLGYYNYSGNYNYNSDKVNENNFNIKARFAKLLNSIPFELVTGLMINNTKYTSGQNITGYNYQRIYFEANPQITLSDENFYLKGGFNFIAANDSTGTQPYFFPKAEGGYNIISTKLVMLAGITGNLKPNTYRSITSENPFATNFILNNTINRFEVYGGFKGELGPMTNFILMGSTASVKNLLFYTQDSVHANQITTYDSTYARLTKLSAAINHSFNEKIRLGIILNLFNYTLNTTLSHPYSRPGLEAKVNATYHIAEKFILKFDLFYMDQRYSRFQLGPDKKIDPFVDANLGIDYRYNKSVSVFLNANNIANNRYQRFYTYPVYGFNIMGGFAFTF